jgi:hypothetical protein
LPAWSFPCWPGETVIPWGDQAPPSAPALTTRPLIGVAAVIVGAFISTINTRLNSVGLADLRGGL